MPRFICNIAAIVFLRCALSLSSAVFFELKIRFSASIDPIADGMENSPLKTFSSLLIGFSLSDRYPISSIGLICSKPFTEE